MTNEGKHTPGPWTLQDNETPWTCGDARTAIEQGEELGHTEIMFDLNAGPEGDDWPIARLVWEPLADESRCDELRANARLIAAAPELLSALRTLRSTIDEDACTCADRSWYGNTHDSACPLTYIEDVDKAIARAEGRTP